MCVKQGRKKCGLGKEKPELGCFMRNKFIFKNLIVHPIHQKPDINLLFQPGSLHLSSIQQKCIIKVHQHRDTLGFR